jgi:hypothetical protein
MSPYAVVSTFIRTEVFSAFEYEIAASSYFFNVPPSKKFSQEKKQKEKQNKTKIINIFFIYYSRKCVKKN